MATQTEQQGLVGRERVLAALELWLGTRGEPPVLFLHAPGGIGKSALVRALASRAAARGFEVVALDGRSPDAVADELQDALADPVADRLVILDSVEQAPAFEALVRELVEPASDARVLLAGREPPGAEWRQRGWEHRLRAVSLEPLAPEAARSLVARRGLDAPGAVEQVVAFAGGSPLALSFATDAVISGQAIALERLDADALLGGALLDRVSSGRESLRDPEVIAVAAIARAVDARMLAAVLPGTDGDRAEALLRELSFAERLGTRVTLHERVRKAVHSTLLAEDPTHENELRRRLADHIHARLALGEKHLSLDLTELIADEAVRWGLAPPPTAYYPSRPAPGDDERIAARLNATGTEWWSGMRRWFEEAPDQVGVIRNADGEIEAVAVWVTPATAPDWAGDDAVIGPWIAHAEANELGPDVCFLREGFDFGPAGTQPSPAISAGNQFVMQRIGVANLRYGYVGVAPDDADMLGFVAAMGYVEHPELDAVDGERRVRCAIRDYGPPGALGFLRDVVYHDLGLPPPQSGAATELAAETVRDALRCFHRPARLAASPLARGGTIEQRAASVRRLLRESVEATFGDSASERLLYAVIERGYLDPHAGHGRAQVELHVSRTTYFRQLGEASDRVAEHVLATLR
jgi:hypothetical protein